jgi:uncharacterized protein YkwD
MRSGRAIGRSSSGSRPRWFAILMLAAALDTSVVASVESLDAGVTGAPGPEAVLDVINAERERRGLRPLKLDRKLNAAAEDRIRDMFDRGYFGHVAPDGTQPDAWVRRRGYTFKGIGENLATGPRTARQAVDHWMRSRAHRRTLLGGFEDAGIAVAPGSPTGRTRGYTFVALFGRE